MGRNQKLPSKVKDPLGWYREVIARAKLAEHAPIKGCMVMRPDGYAIWENIHDTLNPLLKDHGARNVSFPLFIPESYLAREKDHVEGFSPEIAVVTYAGGEELTERIVVRPTSETIIHESMRNWIQSYKDLPLRINQWCNVVRWEKHPRLFLRTSEFQWQEGHTAHATAEEAHTEVDEVLHLYHDYCRDVLALPTVMGRKSEKEKFAGAVESYSIEGLMPDGRALQMGTVHYLGDNFSKMADVSFTDRTNHVKYAEMTSWGVSTRLVGALIMVHGDDKGLILPPKIAPTQVLIVPINSEMLPIAHRVKQRLKASGIRVEIDNRSDVRVGAKFYESELRGIPLRIEIGPKEAEQGKMVVAFRHDGEKHITSLQEENTYNLAGSIKSMLRFIQDSLLKRATRDLNRRIIEIDESRRDTFSYSISKLQGFISAPWCGRTACEQVIKDATGAATRNLPLDRQYLSPDCKCIWCGAPAKHIAYFARAY